MADKQALYSITASKVEAAAWTFMITARAAGWDVGLPYDNGFGYWFIQVFDDLGARGWKHRAIPTDLGDSTKRRMANG